MISRLEINVSKSDRIKSSMGSKGNQKKWYKNGYWLKANYSGYEDIAEVLSYNLLTFTNLPNNLYVPYKLCTIIEDGQKKYDGCLSPTFLQNNETSITLKSLLLRHGFDIDNDLLNAKEVEKKIANVVESLYHLSNVDISNMFSILFHLDSIILNEDRHLNNISLIHTEGLGFRPAPIFDNGLSLLSDISDYPYDLSIPFNISTVQSKPFSKSFRKQASYFNPMFYVEGKGISSFIDKNKDILGRAGEVLKYQLTQSSLVKW